MNPIDIIKSALGVILLAGAAYLVWDYVDTKKQLAVLQNVIEQADAQAKETQIQHERNYDEVKTTLTDRLAKSDLMYKRLLLTKNKTGSSTDANRATRPDDAVTSAIAGSIEYYRQCGEVAIKYEGWREWAIRNLIPVE